MRTRVNEIEAMYERPPARVTVEQQAYACIYFTCLLLVSFGSVTIIFPDDQCRGNLFGGFIFYDLVNDNTRRSKMFSNRGIHYV